MEYGPPPSNDHMWTAVFLVSIFWLLLTVRIPFKFKKDTISQLGNRLMAMSLISLATTVGLIILSLESGMNENLFLKLSKIQGLVNIAIFLLGLLMSKSKRGKS
jgi:uncharacterized membrane protein YwzB